MLHDNLLGEVQKVLKHILTQCMLKRLFNKDVNLVGNK